MRILTVLTVALCTATPLFAQNKLEIYPGVTNFTSRGSVGTGTGEILQAHNGSHWRGIGDNGTKCQIMDFTALFQDQNSATQESFHWSVRRGSDATGPTTGAGGRIARLGPFKMPTGPGGARAFTVTSSLGAGNEVDIPCESNFSIGAELGASLKWTSDGMSCHMARGDGAFAKSVQGASSKADDIAWQILGSATKATKPSLKRTWRMAVLVGNPVLQLGTGGTKYGAGGMSPAVGVPFSARVTAGKAFDGAASMLYLFTRGPVRGGVRLFPGTRLWAMGSLVSLGTATANTNGVATHAIAASFPTAIPAPPIFCQSILVPKAGTPALSNANAVEIK